MRMVPFLEKILTQQKNNKKEPKNKNFHPLEIQGKPQNLVDHQVWGGVVVGNPYWDTGRYPSKRI